MPRPVRCSRAAGADVVCGDVNADGLETTWKRCEDAGGAALGVATDVTERNDVDALIDTAVAEFGRVDAMCNIAGAMFPGLIEDLDDDTIDRGIALNLKGVLYGTQYAIRAMKGSGRGSIVNVSSTAIDAPLRGHRRVRVHQGGGRDAHDDRGDRGGRVRHPRQRDRAGHDRHAVHDLAPEQARRHARPGRRTTSSSRLRGKSPLHIVGEAADQAHLIHYLVSDAAKFATGNIFRVNGGQAMPW